MRHVHVCLLWLKVLLLDLGQNIVILIRQIISCVSHFCVTADTMCFTSLLRYSCCHTVCIVFAHAYNVYSLCSGLYTNTHTFRNKQTFGHFPAVLPFSSLMCV